jgi:hypothetical protein
MAAEERSWLWRHNRIDGQRVNSEGVNNALTEVYHPLVNSKTRDEFDEQLQQLYNSPEAHWRDFDRYLVGAWFVYKALCVTAWTDRHLHFGVHTTSRLEGAQVGLKRWLQNSECVIRRLEPWWATLKADYDSDISDMRILATTVFTVDGFLARVVRIVAPYVLWKQHPEFQAARDMVADARTITPCAGCFTSVRGSACRPKLFELLG